MQACQRMFLALITMLAFGQISTPARAQSPALGASAICLDNGDAALDARLAYDNRLSLLPDEGARNSAQPTTGRTTARVGSIRGTRQILAHSRSSLLQGLSRYDDDTALLISFIADDGSCVWLVNRTGVMAYHRAATTGAQVRQAMSGQLAPLNLRGRAADRAPVRRTLAEGMPARDEPNFAVVVRAIGPSSSTFPPGHRLAIGSVIRLRLGDSVELDGIGPVRRFVGPGAFRIAPAPAAITSPSAPPPDEAAVSDGEAARSSATFLAETVLPASVRAALGNLRNLIIVPDEQMAAYPFALLPLGAAQDARLLIDQVAIQIAPSLIEVGIGRGVHRNLDSSLARMTVDQRASLLRSSIIVGNPAYNDHEWQFRPLPGAEREATRVAQIFGAQPLLGSAARVGAVVDNWQRANPIYVHFASHGIADAQSVVSNTSFVALANGDRFDGESMQAVRFRDGAIIVLSACQTGLGREIEAGIYGLPRMMQLRGAQSVVMSLWNVDDAATAYLMERFAHHLLDTGRAPTALALAMREARNRFDDPAKCASFALFGTGPF